MSNLTLQKGYLVLCVPKLRSAERLFRLYVFQKLLKWVVNHLSIVIKAKGKNDSQYYKTKSKTDYTTKEHCEYSQKCSSCFTKKWVLLLYDP